MTDPGSSSTFQESRRAPHRVPAPPPLAHSLAPSPTTARLDPSSSSSSSFASAPPSREPSLTLDATSITRQKNMLPSHPKSLPTFYASEASASGDESDRDARANEDRVAYTTETRKREEARQRRRAKQASGTPSAGASLQGSPVKQRAGEQLYGKEAYGSNRDGQPGSAMLEGLGFKMGLPETDYQVLVDEAAFHARPARNSPTTTYTSSLGSAVPSPVQSSSAFPNRSRRRSRQFSEASLLNEEQSATPRITVDEVQSLADSDTHRVRFDANTHEPEPEVERRRRPRPKSAAVQLESDHIVFPDTLPPALSPVPSAPAAPASIKSLNSPTSASFFHRRTAPASPPLNRTPSIASSHHGIGSYGSSANSLASQSSLQLVLDDPIPVSPHFSSPSGRSTRMRGRTQSHNSLEEAPPSPGAPLSPNSRSARQAKRPMGPSTIVGEMLAQQDPSRLYFPSPSPKRPASTVSSAERSPPLSIISSVFPSRPKSSSQLASVASPATSTSSRMLPFPPPPSSSKSSSSLVFPPPPVPSSPPRYGRSRYAQRPSPSPRLPNSPSFASTLSSVSAHSVEQPVFPTLGAQLAPDGLVRSGITPRRVSGTPWERSVEDSVPQGDELDRMMAAQVRSDINEEGGDLNEARFREREKERKRRNIYNELIRTRTSQSLEQEGELDSFQRELLARDTVKKSLGTKLMSEEPNRTASEASEEEDAESNGITPSTSASSDISTLPPFPDVPTHTYQLPTSTSCQSGATLDDEDQVEVVLSSASSAASPITPTFSYSYHPTTPPSNPLKQSHRVSLTSSTSDKSHYEDAQEEPSSRVSEDAGPRPEPRLELSKQQTSLWVLDTLASAAAESSTRPLSDIGETEEPEEVLKEDTPPPPPPVASVAAIDFVAAPLAPSSSTASIPLHSPSMAAVQRCSSPTFSQGSRSTASSAPVSYTAPKRLPVGPPAPMKTKGAFGKKFGAFFGGGPSYNAAALGLRGSGVSSRDVANLDRSTKSTSKKHEEMPSKPSRDFSFTRGSSESHTRSNSSSTSSTFPPIPTTPSSFSNATFANPPSSSNLSSENDRGANKLADLLSQFEKEDKARFKAVATSRLAKPSQNAVVV